MSFFHDFGAKPQDYDVKALSTSFGSSITGEHVKVLLLRFEAGGGAVPHAHPQEQVMVVLQGRLRVRFGDKEAELGPGQAFLAPSNVGHQVTALEDAQVLSIKNLVPGDPYSISP